MAGFSKFNKTTTTPPSRPTGEQPGSGYTWGGGITQKPVNSNYGKTMDTPATKPAAPVGTSTAPSGAPSGIASYNRPGSGVKTMQTPSVKPLAPQDRAHVPNRRPGF